MDVDSRQPFRIGNGSPLAVHSETAEHKREFLISDLDHDRRFFVGS